MGKKKVSVDIQNSVYKKGLMSLLRELPWVELVSPYHPDIDVVFTDRPQSRSGGVAFVLVTDCSNKINQSWVEQHMGILCTSDITSIILSTCLTQISNRIKYFSPLVQQYQLKLQFRRSIGEQSMKVLHILLSNPSATFNEQAQMLNISKSTLSARMQELHGIFHSQSRTELVVKVFQSGLAY